MKPLTFLARCAIPLVLLAGTGVAGAQNYPTKPLRLVVPFAPAGPNDILGRLIGQDHAYQKHELVAEMRESGIRRSWVEYVSPRGKFIYKQPVVVLAGHWTGSMGEGMTIALDGMQRAKIVDETS